MNKILVSIGCDHAGFPYKEAVLDLLQKYGYEATDMGTYSKDSVDYPDFVHPVGQSVENGEAHFGIVMCGSGNGVAMTVNKYPNVRAALCWLPEIAALARQHNNANVIAIPVRYVDMETALDMVDTFLHTKFEGGRHERRVLKINATIEK